AEARVPAEWVDKRFKGVLRVRRASERAGYRAERCRLSGKGRSEPGRSPALRFLLVVLGNVFVDLVRELQVLVDVAGIRVVRVGTDGELLLLLPLQDALPLGRAVIAPLDLQAEGLRLLLAEFPILLKVTDQLLLGEEVTR